MMTSAMPSMDCNSICAATGTASTSTLSQKDIGVRGRVTTTPETEHKAVEAGVAPIIEAGVTGCDGFWGRMPNVHFVSGTIHRLASMSVRDMLHHEAAHRVALVVDGGTHGIEQAVD